MLVVVVVVVVVVVGFDLNLLNKRPWLANSNRYKSTEEDISLCTVINTSSPKKEIKHFFTYTRIKIHIIFNTLTNIIITIITITIITVILLFVLLL